MAEEKKEAPAAGKKDEKKKKGGGTVKYIFLGLLFGSSVWFIYPTLLLFIGMIPTVVALFTTNQKEGSAPITAVGAMNLAGICPFVIDLWQKGQTLDHAIAMLATPETWFVMFGAAAMGQLILYAVPQAIAGAAFARAKSRIALLKDHLEVLKNTWGPDVATTKPLEKVMRGE